jgi:hypothetical protein
MSEMNGFVTSLLQNPGLAKSLIADPKTLARAVGVSDEQWNLAKGIGCAVSGLVRRVAGSAATSASCTHAAPGGACVGKASNGRRGTAIAGIVSLVAVTGTIAVLGLVSAVALNKRAKADAS